MMIARHVTTAVAPTTPFADVFDAHFDAVHGYLRRRVGDVAEDLAAETFARALAGYASFDPARGAVRAWLLGIATNLIHDHRRSEARRLRAYVREAGRIAPPAADADAAARLDAAADAGRAVVAIARLARADRDVLLLVAWGELSYEEVAAALGVPVGTVRSRLHRARAAVRKHLEEA
jgi:RNA polymerase sigma-70 factor (ECF subfamily)